MTRIKDKLDAFNVSMDYIANPPKPVIRATGGKLWKYAIQWNGQTYRFERKRDAAAWIEANT